MEELFMKKIILLLLVIFSLTACSQEKIDELEYENLKQELQVEKDLAASRLDRINELVPHVKALVVTEENTITIDKEIVDVIDPYKNVDSVWGGKSLIIMVWPVHGQPKSTDELILENEFQGRQLYDEYISEMQVGKRFKFTYAIIEDLSKTRNIGRIIDIQPADIESLD